MEAADAIATAAIAGLAHLKTPPAGVSVTVLDPSGSVLVQKKMDGSTDAYTSLSLAKAQTCISLQCSSRNFREKYTGDATNAAAFTQAITMTSSLDGRVVPLVGAILVKDNSGGSVVGAVGVSGAASDEDEYLAIQAVQQVTAGAVTTDPPQHSCATLL